MPPQILITETIEGRWIEELKNRFSVRIEPDLWQSPNKLKALLPTHDALIVRNQTQVSQDMTTAGSRLQVIGRAGAGLDNINVKAATAAGIVVVNTPDQNSISVAELTLGMMLGLARKITSADEHVRNGNWERRHFVGTELYNKTLGIVGLGRIGFLTALRARALGMNILAHDAYVTPDEAVVTEPHVELRALKEVVRRADFISCHLPLTSETEQIFDYDQFCRMKPTAFFLNMARGGIVNEQGLIRALKEEQIAGAALDVRQQEPPGKSLLSEMNNVILTPHVAAFTYEAQERVISAVCQNVTLVLEGHAAKNYANISRPKASLIKN